MNEWSSHRKRIVFLITFVFSVFVVAVPVLYFFYDKPTCFDGKMNGGEGGVDCGGSCTLLCTPESLPIVIQGDPRVIEVTPGIYEVALVAKNSNIGAEVYRAGYTINIYSSTSTKPVKTIEGVTHVPQASDFAIFEGPFVLPVEAPLRATFEWKGETLVWKKIAKATPNLELRNEILTGVEERPRVTATLVNSELEPVSNIELITLVYNPEGNVIAASKTFVESLDEGEEREVVFTWPRAFPETVVTTDIIPHVLPDVSFID